MAHPRARRLRLRLRWRVAAAFAFGALVLSLGLAALTYELARAYLLDLREGTLVRQAYFNANLVNSALASEAVDVPELLSTLVLPAGTRPMLAVDDRWYATSLEVGRDALPEPLRARTGADEVVVQRFSLNGVPQLAVGVPLQGAAMLFEVSSLQELSRTLVVLRNSLAAAAAVTTVAGAGVGILVGRRLLRPLSEVAKAAAEVGAGRLDARLERAEDPDLAALADAFNEMTSSLQERVQRDARFASTVSHELRSPLTTVATSLDVLRSRRAELPERAQAALDLLSEEIARFQRLVQELLEISQIDAGASPVALEPVRPGELARHAVSAVAGSEFAVDVDPAAVDVFVEADKRRLERVIANLVENARLHGGGLARVAVERGDGTVRLVVEDAGPGVPPEERERIFERFNRGRSAGRRGAGDGTGLGLALVTEHVRLHRGRVWVEDRTNGGARFVVELPTT